MEEHAPSDADHLIPRSSNTQVNNVLTRIEARVRKLKIKGITTRSDKKTLQDRLKFVWLGPNNESVTQTKWRQKLARQTYTDIYNASKHLFLAVILAISPTECGTRSFDSITEHLLRLKNYEPCRFSLDSVAEEFFKSTAVEQGFSEVSGHMSLIQALFPHKKVRRRFEFEIASVDRLMRFFPPRLWHAINESMIRVWEMAKGPSTTGTEAVRTELSLTGEGDSIMLLDVSLARDIAAELFPGKEPTTLCCKCVLRGAPISEIVSFFGEEIYRAIDESQLRKWEKQLGQIETTDCVEMELRGQDSRHAILKLRIGFELSIKIVNLLY